MRDPIDFCAARLRSSVEAGDFVAAGSELHLYGEAVAEGMRSSPGNRAQLQQDYDNMARWIRAMAGTARENARAELARMQNLGGYAEAGGRAASLVDTAG